jgi:hypothetical protein
VHDAGTGPAPIDGPDTVGVDQRGMTPGMGGRGLLLYA